MLVSSIHSKYTNADYDINVFMPDSEVPIDGFPVIYVLDGLSYYSFARDTIRLQYINSKKTGIIPAIIVGIGHKKNEMRQRRFIDFTGPAEQLIVPHHAKGKIPEEYGGAEQFLSFIENELKPLVEQKYSINKREQSLFGHSLGGYFALWCQFTHPSLFQNYIAISPSVWWNEKELLNMCTTYCMEKKHSNRHTFIGVGEKEGFMVDDAQEIVKILLSHQHSTEYYVAPEENHASVVPTVISRAFRFVLTKNQ
ncbi:alpha/beta hydrolase-fold protein [Fervidibacillus albus]|uniref:Alpha/beta hydrolase-fold protein n=1 Tax=Fervidibacillus albus TaxID=2980026 RepID=A0A9E8RV83_9BACI|nr:alpha/beta hydrolase-fold protein [Fervidibacillus albus]WAA09181.1 alpha/beta hydrolase-fold protein [Fervidibacillus albus]